jgi:conjugal transfer pilus assembly protein TraV
LRSSPRLLRAWFAPWTDSDGDLVGEMRLYLKLDDGDWQLDHVRAGVRQGVAPLRPPPPRSAPPSASANAGTGVPPAVPSLATRPGPTVDMRRPGADEAEDSE